MDIQPHSDEYDPHQTESEGMTCARAQMELFTFDVRDFALKGHAAAFEHPIFSLTKEPDKRRLSYDIDGPNGEAVKLEIIPSGKGVPTVYDQDLLIYIISQLVASLDDGMTRTKVRRRVRFTGHAMLSALGKNRSKHSYEAVKDALLRLRGTTFVTNIPTGPNGEREEEAFSLIDGFLLKKSPDRHGRDRLEAIEVVVSPWLYRAIESREVLTVHEGYLDLAPLEKRIYEIARKHCGPQRAKWEINLPRLYVKAGTGAPMKRFAFNIRAICAANKLPGYSLTIDETAKLTVTHKRDAKVARVVREVMGRKPVSNDKLQATLPLPAQHKPLPSSDSWTEQWEPSHRRFQALLAPYLVNPDFDARAELAAYKADMVGTARPTDPHQDFRRWLDRKREAAILAQRNVRPN